MWSDLVHLGWTPWAAGLICRACLLYRCRPIFAMTGMIKLSIKYNVHVRFTSGHVRWFPVGPKCSNRIEAGVPIVKQLDCICSSSVRYMYCKTHPMQVYRSNMANMDAINRLNNSNLTVIFIWQVMHSHIQSFWYENIYMVSSKLLPSNRLAEWLYWKSLLECGKCEAVSRAEVGEWWTSSLSTKFRRVMVLESDHSPHQLWSVWWTALCQPSLGEWWCWRVITRLALLIQYFNCGTFLHYNNGAINKCATLYCVSFTMFANKRKLNSVTTSINIIEFGTLSMKACLLTRPWFFLVGFYKRGRYSAKLLIIDHKVMCP
jgi:hypothetical protein